MIGDSFEFNGVNFRERFNIRCIKIDHLLPPKRERKTQIPKRHGQFDHGAMYWDERTIRLECDLVQKMTRAETREIAGLLGRKGKLVLWDEPDKHYIGEIYYPPEILDFPKEAIRNFVLEMKCEAFAYSEPKIQELTMGENPCNYQGTWSAPPTIRIENNSDEPVSNIGVMITNRR